MKTFKKLITVTIIIVTVIFIACKEDDLLPEKTLVSISVTTPPAKMIYMRGEAFDPAGMVITAAYSDNTAAAIALSAVNFAYDFSQAGTGKIVTATYEGKSTTITGIIVEPEAPAISGFVPREAANGATLTITGVNFSAVPTENSVTLNGEAVTVKAAIPTELKVIVPKSKTSTGLIRVTVAGKTAISTDVFTYLPEKTVYVSGYEYNSNDLTVAKYWKNGTVVSLTDGTKLAEAHSVLVVGNDVYVAGHENFVAKYWKNGNAVSLTDGTESAEANSILISGSNVYVSGYEWKNSKRVAKYWKNGNAISLTDGTNDAMGFSIFISGSDVYVAGYETKNLHNVAKYWKNGIAKTLTDGTNDAVAYSIFVSGSNVHVSGYEYNSNNLTVARYWKNSVAVSLSEKDSRANAVCVSGSDVYVAGREKGDSLGSYAKYWKNGVAVQLSTKSSNVSAIYISGNDVYTAGYESNADNVAKYWKNGMGIALSDGSNTAYATGIFVVEEE